MSGVSKFTQEMAATQIYGLYDPRDGRLRYIGKANDAGRRLKGHLRDSRRRTTPVYLWISSLLSQGLAPTMRVIAECQPRSWCEVEVALIADARARGEADLNVAAGGNQPECPKAVRAANGAKVSRVRASTPRRARVYVLKREIGRLLANGQVSETNKAKLRLAAQKAPHLFAAWATI